MAAGVKTRKTLNTLTNKALLEIRHKKVDKPFITMENVVNFAVEARTPDNKENNEVHNVIVTSRTPLLSTKKPVLLTKHVTLIKGISTHPL